MGLAAEGPGDPPKGMPENPENGGNFTEDIRIGLGLPENAEVGKVFTGNDGRNYTYSEGRWGMFYGDDSDPNSYHMINFNFGSFMYTASHFPQFTINNLSYRPDPPVVTFPIPRQQFSGPQSCQSVFIVDVIFGAIIDEFKKGLNYGLLEVGVNEGIANNITTGTSIVLTIFVLRKASSFSFSNTGTKTIGRGVAAGGEHVTAKGGLQYTKSNLQLGQQMHKAYKFGANGVKEYRLPSGRRIDFLDIKNGTIYELKPFNPRAMQAGQKQLQMYMQELQTIPQFKGINWKTVLDTY